MKHASLSDQEKVSALQATQLFGELPFETLTRIACVAQPVTLVRNEVLFWAGEPSGGLFVVVQGKTRAIRHGADGREQVIHEDGPGATFSEVAIFDNGPYPSSVTAVEDTVLLCIPKKKILLFCHKHPELALSALRILSLRLRSTTGMVEDLALREVGQRLGEYILAQAEADSDKGVVELVLDHTNQEIAERIGTVREVVSRGFARLQREGWIVKQGRCIRIVDRNGLVDYISGAL